MLFSENDGRGEASNCNYIIVIHILFSILYAVAMLAIHGALLLSIYVEQLKKYQE